MAILQLLNINELNNSYDHTIDFPDIETQDSYFSSKVFRNIDLPEDDDYVYIRENKTIEVDCNKDDLLGVNYLRFKNKDKWWYGFITSKTYINESVTSIEFEVDVLQTFMFDYEIRESFVLREHQDKYDSNYKPIFSTTPENIDLGSEYERYEHTKLNENSPIDIKWFLALCTEPITNQTKQPNDNNINDSQTLQIQGATTTLYAYLFPLINGIPQMDNHNITNFVDIMCYSTATIAIRLLPYSPIKVDVTQINTDYYNINFNSGAHVVRTGNTNFGGLDMSNYGYYCIALDRINSSNLNEFVNQTLDIKSAIQPYTYNDVRSIDREPKLLTHPYEFIKISSYQDEGFIVKRQNVNSDNCDVKHIASTGALQKSKTYVTNYLGDNEGKYNNNINNTICELTLSNSAYTQYIANNKASATTGMAVNTALSLGVTGLRTGIGMTTGNPFAISNAVSDVQGVSKNIINHYFKMQDLQDTPPNISKYGNNGEFDLLDNNNWLYVDKFSIRDTYKLRAYNYFYHYGYSVNDFKIPNLKSRYYFNYIQIPNANIFSNIDDEYIQQISNIFNKGVTIWHYRNADTFKGIENYDYENVEMNLLGV